jgi:hypothetical protein
MEWILGTGKGVIYSFSIVNRPPSPAFAVPYVLALVDLEEGPRLMTHIVECAPEDVAVGRSVAVGFRRVSDEISVPVFTLVHED